VPFRPEPSDQPPAPGQPKPAHGFRPRKMTAKAQRRRKIATINKRLRASATHPPGPRPRMR
jgi:hypothetical protein